MNATLDWWNFLKVQNIRSYFNEFSKHVDKMEPEKDFNIREEIVQIVAHLAEIFHRLCNTEDGESIFVVMMCFVYKFVHVLRQIFPYIC